MARRVVFRPLAEQRLNELFDFISERAAPSIAINYIRRIRALCFSLTEFPERGRRRDDLFAGLRLVVFERRVNIAYRIAESEIEVVTIAYAGRQFEIELHEDRD